MATNLITYRCTQCGKEFGTDRLHYLCDDCSRNYAPGMPLLGVLEAVFDYEAIAKAWKDNPDPLLFSAVDSKFYPPIPVGNTAFFSPALLQTRCPQLRNLWIKNDSLNPSGSYKDRASQLVVADAVQKGIDEIVCASTGNAASSLACIAASAGKKAVIFAPESAPLAKLIQIQVHGAELHKVQGTYDDAFKAALDYTATHECMCRNTGYHPLTVDGKKSAGLEIYIQNGFRVPQWIVIPVGDGVILTGIYKAFIDLQRAGIIDRLPKLLAVQAESSDAITNYWESGIYTDAVKPATIADSISVKTPALAHWAVKAIIDTNGKAIRISDSEIQQAQLELARYAGVFAEPSSAATLAGLKKAIDKGWIPASEGTTERETGTTKRDTEMTDRETGLREEQIVLLITGNGLKDPAAVKL